jgi:hypothetical protein
LRPLGGHVLPAFPQFHDLGSLGEVGRLPTQLSETCGAVGSTEQVAEPDGEAVTEQFH